MNASWDVTPVLTNGEFRASINSIEHWYRVAGAHHATPPLVVLHGGPGGNVYNFERTIGPYLETFSTVVYYDQRGCGRSQEPLEEEAYSIELLVDDLHDLRQQLGIEQIIPLGFSFGGELALEYALAYPQHTLRVIAQAPGVSVPQHAALVQLAGFDLVAHGPLQETIRTITTQLDLDPETRLGQVWSVVDSTTVDRFLFHNAEAAQHNRRLWQESRLQNTGAIARALAKQPRRLPLLIERLAAIQQPALILVGLYDRNSGVDINRNVAAHIQFGQLHVFQHSAHFPDLEEPDQYAAVVCAYVHEAL